MHVHFIAIGGAIMHNLALALQAHGDDVSGSDDEIYEPSRSRLRSAGLMPASMGWDPRRITKDLDTVILGMHARKDNPELLKALEIGIPVMSFPEFVASRSKDKQRVVVAGSHGKTSTTSMIMHVLRDCEIDYDYLVGAQLPGFDRMVRLSDAPVIIIEGDEYLSSPIDRRPKIMHYEPHISCITGVAWDHMNVFPTEEIYHQAFADFLSSLPDSARSYLYGSDPVLHSLAGSAPPSTSIEFYQSVAYDISSNGATARSSSGVSYTMRVFGQHNFENMEAARRICRDLGVEDDTFFKAMQTFEGASMRLQVAIRRDDLVVYRDFAHAPSKVKATVEAVRERHPHRELLAVCELHTFSSLNRAFLPQYKGVLSSADHAVVYYSPHTLQMKKLPEISAQEVSKAFGGGVTVCTSPEEILDKLNSIDHSGAHLWMSSGRFGGIDLQDVY